MSTIETAEATPPRKRRLRFRKMTWALIAWCTLIIVWLVAAQRDAAQTYHDCVNDQELGQELCESAVAAGSGIGTLLVLGIGFFGFVFLSLIWFMSRPRQVVYVSS